MHRKLFQYILIVILLFSLVMGCAQQAVIPQTPQVVNVTILHTNDTHAHLEDIAKRATEVNKIRDAVGKNNMLFLDGGDVFAGTLYYNLMRGQADLDFMTRLGYDAMTFGNHEFDGYDKKSQYLTGFVEKAPFPIVCANVDLSQDVNLKNKTQPWIILERSGAKFGIFGLLTEDTAEISNPGKTITIKNHIDVAREIVKELQKKGINKVIALTHIGWDEDIKLAKEVPGIDLIIGGHSHTLPKVYPTIVEAAEPTLIVQAQCYGVYLGKLDLTFDNKGIISKNSGTLIEVSKSTADADYTAQLAKYRTPIEELKKQAVGKTLVDLDGQREHVRSMETNLGNLIADAMLSKAAMVQATIAILNGGSIRTSIPAGDINLGQVLEAQPFGGDIVAFDITGDQVIAALENGVSQVESGAGRFPQVSGIKLVWDPKAQPGSRVISVDVKNNSGYMPIDKTAKYRIVTVSFLYGGGDGYVTFTKGTNVEYLGYIDYELLREYIEQHSPVKPEVEGRITRVTK